MSKEAKSKSGFSEKGMELTNVRQRISDKKLDCFEYLKFMPAI